MWVLRIVFCYAMRVVIELFILSFPLLLMNDDSAFVHACDCILCVLVSCFKVLMHFVLISSAAGFCYSWEIAG